MRLKKFKIFEYKRDYAEIWDNLQYDDLDHHNLPERLEKTEWKYVDTKTQFLFKKWIETDNYLY